MADCPQWAAGCDLRVPKIGEKEKLVELAKKNASLVLSQDRERIKREEGRTIGAMKEIADILGMAWESNASKPSISPISMASNLSVP